MLASQPDKLKIGEIAPFFTLPDLSGHPVSLVDFRGQQVLLLFWDSGCGFCVQMLPDLKNWEEAGPKKRSLTLLVVSTGSINKNQSLGLSSPVLLDEELTIGPAFGVHGTPMAVLIDDKGKIASEVAVGASAVLGLASAE
jgi:peroxiredoxin